MRPLEVWKADCKRNLVSLALYMILKAILCVQHFCSFGAMLFIVNLLIKTDFTVICVPCMLEHACYMSHFLQKISNLEDILCELLEFCVLSEIHGSKTQFKQINENLKTKRLCTHVLGTCVQNVIPLAS